jgi:hypothetical protein
MKTARDLADDILYALGPSHASNSLVLSIAYRITAEHMLDAELENGKSVCCAVSRLYLLELADAFSAVAKKEAKSA